MRSANKPRFGGLVIALACVATFVACKREKEQNGPQILVPSEQGIVTGDETKAPGSYTLRFKLIFQKGSGKDDAELKDFSFSFNSGAGNVPIITNRPAPGRESFTFDTSFSINGADGQTYTYTFSVRDKNEKTASKSFRITFRQQQSTPQGRVFEGQNLQLNSTSCFLVVGSASIEVKPLSELGTPGNVLAAFIYRTQAPRTYTLVTPDSLGKGNYQLAPINWTASSKPTTVFYSIGEAEYNQATDSAAIRTLVNSLTDNNKVKYINNGDGARAMIAIESGDSNPSNTDGPHPYLGFRQSLGNTQIWGVIKRESFGNGSATVTVKAIRL
ncbi:MAG: hypothetical protein RMK19_03245 [Bacteroidia bacterium]|nr:hypothetical protein [Bacteroidia bacterium]MDW8015008.1 hypothetical protein [Bacteroidia bacterium]